MPVNQSEESIWSVWTNGSGGLWPEHLLHVLQARRVQEGQLVEAQSGVPLPHAGQDAVVEVGLVGDDEDLQPGLREQV